MQKTNVRMKRTINRHYKGNGAVARIKAWQAKNGYKALTDMVDRGYESYNVFAHMEQKGRKYLIR